VEILFDAESAGQVAKDEGVKQSPLRLMTFSETDRISLTSFSLTGYDGREQAFTNIITTVVMALNFLKQCKSFKTFIQRSSGISGTGETMRFDLGFFVLGEPEGGSTEIASTLVRPTQEVGGIALWLCGLISVPAAK